MTSVIRHNPKATNVFECECDDCVRAQVVLNRACGLYPETRDTYIEKTYYDSNGEMHKSRIYDKYLDKGYE